MRLGKTSFIYFITQAVISLSGFVATLFIANVMGSTVLGKYATALAFLFWAMIPAMATSNAVNKRISEGVEQGNFLSAGIVLNIAIALTGIFIVLMFEQRVNQQVGADISFLITGLFVAAVLKQTLNQSLKGQKRVAEVGVAGAIERTIRTGLQLGFVTVAGYEIAGLFIGHILSFAVAVAIAVGLTTAKPSPPQKRHFISLLSYARYSWLGALQARAFGWMDTIVLSFFVAKSLIGIYEVSWSLASMLGLVSISIKQTLFPQISNVSVDNDYEHIHSILSDGLVFAGVFAIPGLFGAIAVGDRVLELYGSEFSRGGNILIILILARLISAYSSQFTSTLNAIDRPRVAFHVNLSFVISNVCLNVGLVWAIGWIGAAIATAISVTLMLILSHASLARLIGPPDIPINEISRQVAASVVMTGVVLVTREFVPSGIPGTLLLVLFGAAIYVGTLILISEFVRHKLITLFPR